MYEQLKERVTALLSQPRPLKPQTERQLSQHLSEHTADLRSFLRCAAEVLEEHELDVLFGPVFTPSLDDRAAVAETLFHWRPDETDLARLTAELTGQLSHTVIELPDATQANLTLHEVMIDRFVRLLRLRHAPDAATAAALRDALPAALWPVALALMCERGMTPKHQRWFAAFLNHAAERHVVSRDYLETLTDFIAHEPDLAPDALVAAAEKLHRATMETATFAASGRLYWSADVAQHHQYRGQGVVDQGRVAHQQAELERVEQMLEDLRTCGGADGVKEAEQA